MVVKISLKKKIKSHKITKKVGYESKEEVEVMNTLLHLTYENF